jgi:hypothetical protein
MDGLSRRDIEFLKEFVQKQRTDPDPKLTPEFIQRLSDLVDTHDDISRRVMELTLELNAVKKLLAEKHVCSDEEYGRRVEEALDGFRVPVDKKKLKELDEEATSAYIR